GAHGVGELVRLAARHAHAREEDVHPEGPVGLVSDLPDLLPQLAWGQVGGGDNAEPARPGDGGGQRRARHVAHARLADRVADTEEIADRGVERASCGGRHAGPLMLSSSARRRRCSLELCPPRRAWEKTTARRGPCRARSPGWPPPPPPWRARPGSRRRRAALPRCRPGYRAAADR